MAFTDVTGIPAHVFLFNDVTETATDNVVDTESETVPETTTDGIAEAKAANLQPSTELFQKPNNLQNQTFQFRLASK